MSENELLVLAAKAAGHEVEVVGNTVWINGDYYSAQNTRPWNPLMNDAEALRLAVKLSLALTRAANAQTSRYADHITRY